MYTLAPAVDVDEGPVPPNPAVTLAADWRAARRQAAAHLAHARVVEHALDEWAQLSSAHQALSRAARLSPAVHNDPTLDLTDRERVEWVEVDRDAVACVTMLVLCAHARAHHSGLRRGWWPDLEAAAALPLGVLSCAASPDHARDRAYRELMSALLSLDVDPDVIASYLDEQEQ